jgi:hypothetical protein
VGIGAGGGGGGGANVRHEWAALVLGHGFNAVTIIYTIYNIESSSATT